MSNSIKVKATNLKKILTEKGHNIKHTECIEVMSMMENGQCYNVAKNQTIRILKENERLTVEEVEKNDFKVDVVIPVPMSALLDGMESFNDYVSETITGSECGLSDISYEIFPYFYGEKRIAMRINAYVEDTESFSFLDENSREDN